MTTVDQFRTWLERRGCYSHSSIETWVRIARRLVDACPDGIYPVTPEDAADLLAPAACMPHTRYNLRSGTRQFYEFLESR